MPSGEEIPTKPLLIGRKLDSGTCLMLMLCFRDGCAHRCQEDMDVLCPNKPLCQQGLMRGAEPNECDVYS